METKNKTNQVFLVDDDETYLDTLEHNLKKNVESNVILKTFPTGEECLKELHQKPKPQPSHFFQFPRRNQAAQNQTAGGSCQ